MLNDWLLSFAFLRKENTKFILCLYLSATHEKSPLWVLLALHVVNIYTNMEDGLQIEILHTELININHTNKKQTAFHVLNEIYTK